MKSQQWSNLTAHDLVKELLLDPRIFHQRMTFQQDERLFPQDEDYLYYIQKGAICGKHENGSDHDFQSGDFMDMRYILPGEVAPCQYVAKQISKVIALKKWDVLSYIIGQGEAWFLVDQLHRAHQKDIERFLS
ncbi:hypothetical protein [Listeria ilorinensis]|uniref:hypothetical protein n=1 Tax=Listeria ilorinensis TaxID=2867439 RepID=UPI001EF4AC36|nr:hypothetical protein [Listeria ilorinensis]